MLSTAVEREALTAAVDSLTGLDFAALAAPERFAVLEWIETQQRRLTAIALTGVGSLEQFEGCPPVGIALADVLRVSPREAKRRIRDAAQLTARTTLTGEPLEPALPETAKAWNAGLLDSEHLRVIQKFFRDLPDHVPRPRPCRPKRRWPTRRPCYARTSWSASPTGWPCI